MIKLSFEQRLTAAKRYLNGEASTLIARELGMDHHDVVVYAMRYEKHGVKGLEDRQRRPWTVKEKMSAVNDYLKESLTLKEIAIKHEISLGTLKGWIRSYKLSGIDSLEDKRKHNKGKSLMAKSRKNPSQMTNEELLELVKDLQAENALLKKVKALVEKKEAPKRKIGPTPSKN